MLVGSTGDDSLFYFLFEVYQRGVSKRCIKIMKMGGWVMVLGSFQCRGVLLHMVGRACCACSRCGMGGLFVILVFHLVYPIFIF